jgi:hypothetical protein
MDKDRRLRRYRRKDYTEIVGFPVEIVGRDRTVRQYDFEESIRLYQRRLTFVHLRFHDEDLAAAEAGHCRARIDQLRRSYFHLHGWSTPPGVRGFDVAHPRHAGELAAFLLRVLGEDDRLDVRITEVGRDGEAELWHVARGSGAPSLLVYAWFFHDEDVGAARVREHLRVLGGCGGAGGDGERLLASHVVADCAFALTGRAGDVGGLAATVTDEVEDPDDGIASPWDEACAVVRRGDLAGGWVRCRTIVESQPWHRDAYVLGTALAILLRRPSEAEDLAFVGTTYLPGEPLLLRSLGLARLHEDRPSDAVAPLEQALAGAPDDGSIRALLVLALGRSGRWIAAARAARRGGLPAAQRANLDTLVGTSVRGAVFGAFAFVTLGLVVAALVETGWPALLPALGWALVTSGGVALFRRRLDAVQARLMLEDPSVTLARLRRGRRVGAPS